MSSEPTVQTPAPLAITGIGCRFPGGADDPETFWDFLCEGKSAITEVPEDRWNADRFYSPDISAKGKIVTKWGGFVDQLHDFDAEFFSITPREASRLDPQQRWLLEITLEAMEDAHCPPDSLRNTSTGVFVGLSDSDYGKIQTDYVEQIDGYSNSGNTLSIASNRISFQFDLKGPSMTVDTACSSGLVAVNLACRSLWSGECDHALAGAVGALILPHSSFGFSKANMFSPTGKCHAFDSRADGYVRGEGAGMVLIKPLSDAIRDGNHIYSVIRASAVNQDGRTSSLTVPSLDSQKAMLEEALSIAGLLPENVSYVEAHGTGTPVGDPIEARALGEVLRRGRTENETCLIGSVKTNIGHLEPASGLAGLIKASLIAKHGLVPPSLNFETPNPNIPFDELRLRVATERAELPRPPDGDSTIVVNSFGFGGTNAQVILQPPPTPEAVALRNHNRMPGARPLVLTISAANPPALESAVGQYTNCLEQDEPATLDICASAAMNRQHREHRLAVVANDRDELIEALSQFPQSEKCISGKQVGSAARRPVFVFTGQGAQWWGMGRKLLEEEDVFRETVETINDHLESLAGWSLIEELGKSKETSRIDHTGVAQPALFALQAGLSKVWQSWGIKPGAVIGHSVGEVAAAYTAGIYSLEDATRLVFHRSRLQARTGGKGRMAAVGIPVEEARRRIDAYPGRVEIAVVNSPSLVTLAGDTEPLEEVVEALASDGLFTRWLPIGYAFHTHQMEPIREDLLASLEFLEPKSSEIPMISTATGQRVSGEKLDAEYWWQNVRSPVLFSDAVGAAVTSGEDFFVEIGPHPSLRGPLLDCLATQKTSGRVFHSLKREEDDCLEIARNLAGLHTAGVAVDWLSYFGSSPDPGTRLPRYPWQRQAFWNESPETKRFRLAPSEHCFLDHEVDAPNPAWDTLMDAGSFPFLEDHKLWNRVVFPAAGFAEIGLAVARTLPSSKGWVVEDLELKQILFLGRDTATTMRTEYSAEEKRFRTFCRISGEENWTLHASGRLVQTPKPLDTTIDLSSERNRLPMHEAHYDFYEGLKEAGYQFGPRFNLIDQVWFGDGISLARISVPDELEKEIDDYIFHPAVLDACFQSISAAAKDIETTEHPLMLPSAIGRIQADVHPPPKRFWVRADIEEKTEDSTVSLVELFDDSGSKFGEILGFKLSTVRDFKSPGGLDEVFYRFAWRHAKSATAEGPGSASKPDVVVFADTKGIGDEVGKKLRAVGHSVHLIYAGDRFSSEDNSRTTVVPGDLEHLRRALGSGTGDDTKCLHLWSLDHPEDGSLDETMLRGSQRSGVYALLALAKVLPSFPKISSIMCFLPSTAASSEHAISSLTSAPMLGFLRVAASEITNRHWKSVLLSRDLEDLPSAIVGEFRETDVESEVALTEGIRSVRRFVSTSLDDLPAQTTTLTLQDDDTTSYRIGVGSPGALDKVEILESRRTPPESKEIEVRVEAAGINFRDLMKVLGTYPGAPANSVDLGDEFSGIVTKTGSEVTSWKEGDAVVGFSPGSFRSHVVTGEEAVFRKPEPLSAIEAAAFPTVFLTASFAIKRLARMKSGDSILIHTAAGGVGLAAVQVAQDLGLEIFATAGSKEKRRMLRDRGVEQVMDSRSLAFADEVMKLTRGRGVDAVLNSLSGEFLLKSLSVLAPFGNFLEIGKVDIYSDSRIGMFALRNNISFHAIDLDQFVQSRPAEAKQILEEIVSGFEQGRFTPLPCETFPATEVGPAFRKMARGFHHGKLVLEFPEKEVRARTREESRNLFTGEKTYVVSGGAAGFGFEIAKWLARNGARHIALMSRTGPKAESTVLEIERLREKGIVVRDVRVDIADGRAVGKEIEEIENEMPPVGGVVHAAMVLDNRPIEELDDDSFSAAFDPKAYGGWNLHSATLHRKLDFFLCFSSFAAVIGAFKQANYNAGNTFLDELCHYRQDLGLQALSINWGSLSGTGYVEREQKTRDYLEAVGVRAFPTEEVITLVERLLSRNTPQITAAKVDWATLVHLAPGIARVPLYETVVKNLENRFSAGSFRPMVLAATADQQKNMIEELIASEIADVFGSDDVIDRSLPVTELGLDSLMAIELLNRIESQLGIQFPIGSILNGPSIEELSGPVLEALVRSVDSLEESEPAAQRDSESEGVEPRTGLRPNEVNETAHA